MAQAAAVQPDIQLGVRLTAERVTIEKKGEARLTLTTSPEGENKVDVQAPKADGRRTLRDVAVSVDAQAKIADRDIPVDAETVTPPPR